MAQNYTRFKKWTAAGYYKADKFHLEPHDDVRSSVAHIKDSFWFYFSKLVSHYYVFLYHFVCFVVCVFYFYCSCYIRAYIKLMMTMITGSVSATEIPRKSGNNYTRIEITRAPSLG